MDRTIELVAPPEAEKHKFLLERMTGWEGLGRPFWYDVEMLSKEGHVDKFELLGKPMTVQVMMEAMGGLPAPPRFFRGLITRFTQVGWTGDYFRYRAHLRPALWAMTRNVNSRIFQPTTVGAPMTVVAILKQVFQENGVETDFKLLGNKYYEHEFVVQYQESDFNFVSRLMEREGIYYFFKHESDRETLVLADEVTALQAQTGSEILPFFPPSEQRTDRRERDHIESWTSEMQVEPELYTVKDYDFEKPTAPMEAEQPAARRLEARPGARTFEVYEYPGRIRFKQDDKRPAYAERRLEEQRIDFDHYLGEGNARAIIPGSVFTLTGYPGESDVELEGAKKGEPRKFLVTGASYTVVTNEYTSGSGDNEEDYRVSFRAVHADTQYRSPLVTPRPTVQGPQTAEVVGEAGAEISTDKHGRVKVKFRWDRPYDVKDENSSCWVSVSQLWAGAGWGAMHIPRIGQEVIVDFLEGDPDQPIIIGRVYNEDRQPPADVKLPDNKTQSYIRSRSTPGGGPSNYNEIRFEDKKGEEKLFMQAEKDEIIKVKNDRTTNVDHDDNLTVGNNRTVTIVGNLKLTVQGKVDPKGDSKFHSAYKVVGKHELDVTQSINIKAPDFIELKCVGSTIKMEPGKITFHAGDGAEMVLDAKVFAIAAGGGNMTIDPDVLSVSKNGGQTLINADVTAASSGGSTLKLDGDAAMSTPGKGSVNGATTLLNGKTEATVAGGGATVKADGGVTVVGSKVDVSGGMVNIAGGLVKIN